MTTQTQVEPPRTDAGRRMLADDMTRAGLTPTELHGHILKVEQEAAANERLRLVERIREALPNVPTVKALTMRLGTFNDVWWKRFAQEVADALASESEPQ